MTTDISSDTSLESVERDDFRLTSANIALSGGGTVTGADIESTWTGPDGDGNYSSSASWSNPTWVLRDGIALKHGSGAASLAANEWYYDSGASQVLLGSDPAGSTIEIGARFTGIDSNAQASAQVENLSFEAQRAAGFGSSSLWFNNSSGGEVRGVTWYACRNGVECRGVTDNVSVSGCAIELVAAGLDVVEDSGAPDNITFRHNHIRGTWLWNGTDVEDFLEHIGGTHGGAPDSDGIGGTGNFTNYQAEDNDVAEQQNGVTWVVNTAAAAATGAIRRNRVRHCDDDGINIVTAAQDDAVFDVDIEANIVAVWGHPGADAGAPSAFAINVATAGTAIVASVAKVSQCVLYQWSNLLRGADNIDLHFHNNICVNPTDDDNTAYYLVLSEVNAASNIKALNGNCYWNELGTNAKWRWPDGTIETTLSGWQTTSGMETDSLNVDPLFLNPTNDDYRLDGDSPCIGAGTEWWDSPADQPHDFEGRRYRVTSGVDMGAYSVRPDLAYGRKATAFDAGVLQAGADIAKAREV